MSAFLDISEQRRVEELSRASQERLQASARLATVGEMASLLSHELNAAAGRDLQLCHRFAQPAEPPAAPPAAPPELAMAMRRIAEQAERAGQVIRSVHDFVRRRDRRAKPVAPQALIDAVLPLVRLQARKLGVRVEIARRGAPAARCCATARWSSRCCSTWRAMPCRRWTSPAWRDRVLVLRRCARGAAAGGDGRGTALARVLGGRHRPRHRRRGGGSSLFTPFFTTKPRRHGPGPEPVPHGGRAARRRARCSSPTGRAVRCSASPCRSRLARHHLMQPADRCPDLHRRRRRQRARGAGLAAAFAPPASARAIASAEDFEAMLAEAASAPSSRAACCWTCACPA